MRAKKIFILLLTLSFIASAEAGSTIEWSSSNVQVYAVDFIFGEQRRATVTVEHAHG